LSGELNMVKDYVWINEFSYNASFQLLVEVEERIMNCCIFKHMLQPLVENAILHGLNGKEEGGYIRIHGYREGDILRITVADNGRGMSAEKIAQVMSDEPTSAPGGYGTKNLIKRIKMYFGEPYGLTLDSSPGAGTVVTLTIRAIEDKSYWDI